MIKQKVITKRIMLIGALLLLPTSAIFTSSAGSKLRPALAPTQAESQSYSAQLVRVFVHGDDLYPDVINTSPGKILLRAENETQSDVSLVVERVTPGQANQSFANISTIGQAKRATQELTLTAGEYVYYEQSRPEIRGRLIVESK